MCRPATGFGRPRGGVHRPDRWAHRAADLVFSPLELGVVDVPAAKPVLAIDLGGTQIRAAHVAPDLTVSLRRACATQGEEGPDAVIGRIRDLARDVLDAIGTNGLEPS